MYKKFLILCLLFSSLSYGFESGNGFESNFETEPSFSSFLNNILSNFPMLSIKYDKKNANFDEIRNIPEWQQQFPKVPSTGPVAWHHVLGVSPDAPEGEIKKAYYRLSNLMHPDKSKRPSANIEFDLVKQASEYTASEKQPAYTIHYTTPNLAEQNIVYPVEETTLGSLGKAFGETEEEKNAFMSLDRPLSHWKYYMLAQVATVVGLKKAYNYSQSKDFKAAHPHIAKFSKLISGLSLMGVARYWPNSLTPLGNVVLKMRCIPVSLDLTDEAISKIKIIQDPEHFGVFGGPQQPPHGYIGKEDLQTLNSIAGRRLLSACSSGTIGLAGFWITLTALKDLAFGSNDSSYDPFLDDEF